MNGINPTSQSSGQLTAGGGLVAPIKNLKRFSLTQVDNGFLIEMQNVDTYGIKNNVAMDLESALEIAKTYFAD